VSGASVELSTEEILKTALISYFDNVIQKLDDQGLLKKSGNKEMTCPTLASLTDTLRVILTQCVDGVRPHEIARTLDEKESEDQEGWHQGQERSNSQHELTMFVSKQN
jgi:hypothetical protein